jgi:hypothetical protein
VRKPAPFRRQPVGPCVLKCTGHAKSSIAEWGTPWYAPQLLRYRSARECAAAMVVRHPTLVGILSSISLWIGMLWILLYVLY